VAEHQAMLGAQADPTLYACHFDGVTLNSLGKAKLDAMLVREGRDALARAAFAFLPTRAKLDLAGFEDSDIFAH
jgi:hypothetical protein